MHKYTLEYVCQHVSDLLLVLLNLKQEYDKSEHKEKTKVVEVTCTVTSIKIGHFKIWRGKFLVQEHTSCLFASSVSSLSVACFDLFFLPLSLVLALCVVKVDAEVERYIHKGSHLLHGYKRKCHVPNDVPHWQVPTLCIGFFSASSLSYQNFHNPSSQCSRFTVKKHASCKNSYIHLTIIFILEKKSLLSTGYHYPNATWEFHFCPSPLPCQILDYWKEPPSHQVMPKSSLILTCSGAGMPECSDLGVGQASQQRYDVVHHVLVIDDAVLTLTHQHHYELREVVFELLPDRARHDQGVVTTFLRIET